MTFIYRFKTFSKTCAALASAIMVLAAFSALAPKVSAADAAQYSVYTINAQATFSITTSGLLATGLSDQTAINNAVGSAVNKGIPFMGVTLTSDNAGNTDYTNVRFIVVGTDNHLQLWAQDTKGNWYDIVKSGWGDSNGFALPSVLPASGVTTKVYPISDNPQTYNLTVNLSDLDSIGSQPIAAETGELVVTAKDYTGSDALSCVQPQDFAVMQLSGVNGYNVGFVLQDLKASETKQIEVSLYKDSTLLATATSNQLQKDYTDATSLSAPFDINGIFDYAKDGVWFYSKWQGDVTDVPTRAVIKVTDNLGNTYTVENAALTGNPEILIPKHYQGADALSFVQPQDFAVMQLSKVNGYNVGFKLLKAKAGELKKVEVSLYKGGEKLAANVSNEILSQYKDSYQLSSPFNINGYFDYTADKAWTNTVPWTGTVEDIPDKAEIVVTDWMDNTYTVDNTVLSGDTDSLLPKNYMDAQALAFVQPQDFGTMQLSGVNGYNVGFKLLTVKAKDLKNVVVKLYKDQTLLAVNTSNQILSEYPDVDQLSSPFNINGTFDYKTDGMWTNNGWNGSLTDIPTKAVIIVTDKMDNTYTVENTTLTGAPLPYITMGDFGVMQLSGVNGYNVGFGLVGMQAQDLKSVKVRLYKGEVLLDENTADGLMSTYQTASQLSSPFNINGTFSYDTDGAWGSSGWKGQLTDVPDKVEIQAVDKLENTYLITSQNAPTGDSALLIPQNYVDEQAANFVQFTDFGTMQFSGINGYSVGFKLVNIPGQINNIKVKLYKGDVLLSSNVSAPALLTLGKVLSSPFNINGTFDYVKDGYWTNDGWKGRLADVPTKAEIVVTGRYGDIITIDNTNAPTGPALPYAVAEDFGVMQLSGVNGYTVGFGLVGMQAQDLRSIKVELYKGTQLLSQDVNNEIIGLYPTATQLSAPFDINGIFDYAADKAWSNGGWQGTVWNVPDKAVVTLIDKAGNTYVITNTQLSGDPKLLDTTDPVGTIEYSEDASVPTKNDVIATVTTNEPVVYTSEGGNIHTFTENGSFTFNFVDFAGHTGSVVATVNNIQKTAPVITYGGGGVVFTTPVATSTPVGQILGAVTIKNGSLVLDGSTVYLISKGQKRPFASEAEFLSYGYKFSDIVTSDAIKDMPAGDVMRAMDGTLAVDNASSDGTVYLVGSNGIKRGFISEKVFKDLGFSFGQVRKMNLTGYQKGLDISSVGDAHPDGTLAWDGKTVWWISNGHRRGFPSMEVFNSYILSMDSVVKANVADMALPEGSLIQLRDLALAQ